MGFQLHKAIMPLAALLLLPSAAAQDIFKTFDIYSSATCGMDPNDLTTLSSTFNVFSQAKADPETGRVTSGCMHAAIEYREWPRPTKESPYYNVWVDAKNIEDSCELVFYNIPEGDESMNEGSCFQPFRRITPKSSCGRLRLTQNFGYAYCCGEDCRKIPGDLSPVTEEKRQEKQPQEKQQQQQQRRRRNKPAVDVAAVKRAAAAPMLQGRKEECRFERTDGGANQYTYGPQVQAGRIQECPPGTSGCAAWTWSYSVGRVVTNGVGTTMSVGANWGPVAVSVDASMHEENSDSEDFTTSDTITAEPDTTGYPAFMPKLICGKGKLVGDCEDAEDLGEGTYCINVLVNGQPDGLINVVYVN